ncbi:MAG: hypothetical protein ABSF33_04225 [Acidimicrobiales bacterium]|jgi:hypothetical protein
MTSFSATSGKIPSAAQPEGAIRVAARDAHPLGSMLRAWMVQSLLAEVDALRVEP